MYLGNLGNADLSLLGNASPDEIVAAAQSSDLKQQTQFANGVRSAAKAVVGASRASRRAFLERMGELPLDVQEGLKNRSLQISDMSYYSCKAIGARTLIRMWEPADAKKVCYTNLNNGQLEKGAFFLPYAVRLLFGTNVVAGTFDPARINFSDLPDYILNGEFEMRCNGTVMLPSQSCEQFNTESRTDITTATFILDNPKVVRDQQLFEVNLEWGVPAPADKVLKVIVFGSTIAKS